MILIQYIFIVRKISSQKKILKYIWHYRQTTIRIQKKIRCSFYCFGPLSSISCSMDSFFSFKLKILLLFDSRPFVILNAIFSRDTYVYVYSILFIQILHVFFMLPLFISLFLSARLYQKK